MAESSTSNVEGFKHKKHASEATITIGMELFNELLHENEHLTKENTRLGKENNDLWNQSAKVFQQNRDKRLEMVDGPYALGTVIDELRHLYTADWCNIWKEGEDDCSTMQQISDMLKVVNEQCTQRANQQIRSFLCLNDENEPVPTRQEMPDIYRLRRKVSIDPYVRERVITSIFSELQNDSRYQSININAEGNKEVDSRNFFKEFAGFCWLLAIAEERVTVVFDVIGEDYDNIKDRFDKYHFVNHKVTGKKLNSVKTLVWPCILMEDGTLLDKGDVIVVENIETQC